MLVGISILVACATFFAYLQLPGASSHDQPDASTPNPNSTTVSGSTSQQSNSFPALMWAFLCASLGVSSSRRGRGSGGGQSPSPRGLGGKAASVGSSASIQLPLLPQGSPFPISTSSTSPSATSLPAISPMPRMKVVSPEESPDATPRARPVEFPNGVASIPFIQLSIEDEEIDDTPPTFPAINSAQRARSITNENSISLYPQKLNGNTPSSQPVGSFMPPPPLPQIRGRNPRSQPTILPSAARGPAPQRTPFLSGTAGGTALTVNGGISSIGSGGLPVPSIYREPPTKTNRKVTLEPGHSPLDWARLCRTAPPEVLRGPDIPLELLRVTPSMLAKHGRPRKPRGRDKSIVDSDEAEPVETVWMALEGKVYNITAYIPFHPGGEGELLRCAGKDGTSLFMKTHSWVNIDGMLKGCLVGILISEEEVRDNEVKVGAGLEDVD